MLSLIVQSWSSSPQEKTCRRQVGVVFVTAVLSVPAQKKERSDKMSASVAVLRETAKKKLVFGIYYFYLLGTYHKYAKSRCEISVKGIVF